MTSVELIKKFGIFSIFIKTIHIFIQSECCSLCFSLVLTRDWEDTWLCSHDNFRSWHTGHGIGMESERLFTFHFNVWENLFGSKPVCVVL